MFILQKLHAERNKNDSYTKLSMKPQFTQSKTYYYNSLATVAALCLCFSFFFISCHFFIVPHSFWLIKIYLCLHRVMLVGPAQCCLASLPPTTIPLSILLFFLAVHQVDSVPYNFSYFIAGILKDSNEQHGTRNPFYFAFHFRLFAVDTLPTDT